MRVLCLTTLFPSALDPVQGIFVYQRISSFAKLTGSEVEVICPAPFAPRWIKSPSRRRFSQAPKEEVWGGFRIHHPRYALLPKISMAAHGALMFLGVRNLAMRLHEEKPFDCIDAHYVYPDGFAAVLTARALGIPVVVSARGTDINLFPSFRSIRPLIQWTLQQCSGIVSVSARLKDLMVDLGTPAAKIEVIGNGVDVERFDLVDRRCARRKLGLPEAGQILLCVASLREAKGQQHVISALTRIAARHAELKLFLVGEGPYRKHLEDLIRQFQLQDRVVLTGNRDNAEIPLWFNAADVSILASAREGWPNVVLESLACGTPVIGSPAGEIPEILTSPELGIVTETKPESLAEAIEASLGRAWDRQTLADYARRRPWIKVAEEMDAYFRRIVS